LSSGLPSHAEAYETTFAWSSGKFDYRINLQSFVDHVNSTTLSLSTGDYAWWINHAASVWRTRTGADIDFGYLGTTSVECEDFYDPGGGRVGDEESSIAAQDGCKNIGGVENCASMATTSYITSNGSMSEVDICVYTPPGLVHEVDGSEMAGRVDLIGIIVHEIGHAIGLDHPTTSRVAGVPDGVVMNGTVPGGSLGYRFPYGDDIEGARSLYGTRSHSEFWKRYEPSTETFTQPYSFGGTVNLSTAGTITQTGSSTWSVIRAATSTAADRVWFNDASYPLGLSSVWDDRYWLVDTWHSPALTSNAAAQTTPYYAVAAFPLAADDSASCAGVRIGRSSDLFDSVTYSDYGTVCTNSPVALAYDTTSDRYILVWVDMYWAHHTNPTLRLRSGRLMARTSSDGLDFPVSTERPLGLYANSPPSVACEDSECVLSFVDANSVYPRARNFEVYVDLGLGERLFLESEYTSSSFSGGVVVSARNNSTPFSLFSSWTSNYSNVASGRYGIYANSSPNAPIPPVFSAFGFWSDTQPGVAATEDRARQYLFYAD
jgi:hypothetical protein